ncbi:MAG TPA: DNA-processing protein DprA, partial [Candidatus Polarisedimenticolaceae bacterium]|nr:DNA-processing protein DprA [Candidatus Polarisedimenticolaceae bacterium]
SSPPAKLYIRGELPQSPYIAIVGSRRPTAYGEQITYLLAGELAKAGMAIVSGLAIGIDGIAHRAAIDAGGTTIAVLGSGLNQIYPPRNRKLAAEIATGKGALVSELENDMPALPHHFPQRNRIIAGLCLGVIVTEADASSGSLITANHALQANRTVMAVPGNITSLRSAGPHKLLRAGAVPVTCSEDVLDTLNLHPTALPTPRPTPASRQEAVVLSLLSQGVSNGRDLIEQSGLSAPEFARTISIMEISGKVHNLGAGNWVRR